MRTLLELLRPTQWIKNGFVLAAVVFSLRLEEPAPLLRSLAAFALFCAASSGAYVLNDIADAERDRVHPDKRARPVASGRVPVSRAKVLAAALAGGAVAGSAALGTPMLVCVAAFLALQVAYTLRLKHLAVLDASAIAAAFVLRTVAGVVASGARMSGWLLSVTFSVALFLALAKRRQELLSLGADADAHRPVLGQYRAMPLDAMIVALAAGVVGLYTQYTLRPDVAERLGTDSLYWSVPFVVFGVFRYLFLIYGRERGGNPTDDLLGDPPLLVAVAAWAATVVVLIYG